MRRVETCDTKEIWYRSKLIVCLPVHLFLLFLHIRFLSIAMANIMINEKVSDDLIVMYLVVLYGFTAIQHDRIDIAQAA